MAEQKQPNPPSGQPEDPRVYAGIISNFLTERNPVEAIAGDIARMFGVVINLNRNIRASRQRVQSLQERIDRTERMIADSYPPQYGTRLDKSR